MTDTKWLPDLNGYDGPKFRALATALREAARSGQLPAGSRLPAMRDLAWRLGVTPGTVARAYQIAAAEGVIDSHVGRGSFIARRQQRLGSVQPLITERINPASADRALVDLRIPRLPDCGQTEAIRRAMQAAAQGLGDEVLDYPPSATDRDCRRSLLPWLAWRDLGPIGADDLILAHGGQNAISLVMGLCLVGEKPRLATENLAYPGLRHLARLHRADIAPVALDQQGMRPDSLDQVARLTGARLMVLTASAQNPTAARMPPARRAEIVAVARHHDMQIIEDECFSTPYCGPANRDIPTLRAMAPERVWHVASLSKLFSAGLRFGVVVCPDGMGEAGRLAAQHSFLGLSLPLNAIATQLMQSGEVNRLTRKVQDLVDDRVAIAQQALSQCDLSSQPGLPFLWLRLPPGWRGSTFTQSAADEGVLVRSADEFATICSGNQPIPNAVRIALDCQLPRPALEAGLTRLARLYACPPGELSI